MNRRAVAAVIVLLWLAGLGWLGARETTRTPAERLAEAAQRVAPITYYYMVEHGGRPIGAASSAIDTVGAHLITTDIFRGTFPIAGDTQRIQAAATATLTRALALQTFRATLRGSDAHLTTLSEKAPQNSPILPFSIAPIAFMLTGEPTMGRAQRYWMYNPLARAVQSVELRIHAESVFSVADSAVYDSVGARWFPAHIDTVRAWKITNPSAPLTVWVDAQGRVVSAAEPGGMHMIRTAYEIAFRNRGRP